MTDHTTEALLAGLRPAAPPAALMARLRAANPGKVSGFRVQGSGARRYWLRVAGVAAAAAAAWVFIGQWAAPRAPALARRATTTPVAVAAAAREASQIFLPVDFTRTLISLQPGRVQQPDEPPQRFLRAVWLDDVTAVGAETDAALHLRREHETFVPVSSPVY